MNGQIIDCPADLTENNQQLQMQVVGGVQKQGVYRRSREGEPADEAGVVGEEGKHRLHGNKQDFPERRKGEAEAKQIPGSTDQVGNHAGVAAQQQIAGTHDTELETLDQQDMLFLFDQTDADHDQRSEKGDNVRKNNSFHKTPSDQERISIDNLCEMA